MFVSNEIFFFIFIFSFIPTVNFWFGLSDRAFFTRLARFRPEASHTNLKWKIIVFGIYDVITMTFRFRQSEEANRQKSDSQCGRISIFSTNYFSRYSCTPQAFSVHFHLEKNVIFNGKIFWVKTFFVIFVGNSHCFSFLQTLSISLEKDVRKITHC